MGGEDSGLILGMQAGGGGRGAGGGAHQLAQADDQVVASQVAVFVAGQRLHPAGPSLTDCRGITDRAIGPSLAGQRVITDRLIGSSLSRASPEG